MGCFTGISGVETGMHMNDISSDGHMNRNRYAQAGTGCQNAFLKKGEIFFKDMPAYTLAQPVGSIFGFLNSII